MAGKQIIFTPTVNEKYGLPLEFSFNSSMHFVFNEKTGTIIGTPSED